MKLISTRVVDWKVIEKLHPFYFDLCNNSCNNFKNGECKLKNPKKSKCDYMRFTEEQNESMRERTALSLQLAQIDELYRLVSNDYELINME